MDWLRLKPGPARTRKIQLLQPNYRPRLDCDQQQRARSLKSGPSRPGLEPDRAASEGLSSCLVLQNNQQTSSYSITLMVVVGHGQRDAVVPFCRSVPEIIIFL